MDRAAVASYVDRDWDAVAALKRRFWADQYARLGSAPAWAASDAMWCDAQVLVPDSPTRVDRADDLAAHLTLRDLLDRAASAFPVP